MSIANAYAASGDGQATLEKMAKLLIQNNNIKINVQGKQPVYKERQKKDSQDRVVFRYLGREMVHQSGNHYVYCDNETLVKDNEGSTILFTTDWNLSHYSRYKFLREKYDGVKVEVRTDSIKKNTALHIACQVGAKDIVKILLTHPNASTNIQNYKYESPKDCLERSSRDVIKLEFKKAQKGKELLNALSRGNIYQAKGLLNQELNPNCWKRTYNGEVETPLSLIIKSCLQGMTQDNEEVLTKLLEHKDLDFSQIKPIQAIERNPWVKKIIEQAITKRLTDTINRKDLDDVKKLVEDNCFINRAIVTAALRGVDNPVNSIKDYLNEKFPVSAEQPVADAHNVQPEINDEFIARELQQLENLRDELEKTKAQLAEKENELNSAKQERLSSENGLLSTKSLSNKNKKPSEASAQSRKLSNCASACFILLGVYAVGACLVIEYSPEMSAFFAALALIAFLLGCFSLYGANKRDIGPDGTTDNPQVTRVLTSSPNSAENFCTC